MIARQIGIVLCRVGAAVLTVQAIRSLGYTIPGLVYANNEFGAEIWRLGLLSVVPGLAAIGLWIFADRVCNVPAEIEYEQTPQSVRGVDIVRVGTTLIGVYVVISGIVSGVNVEVLDWMRSDLGGEYQWETAESKARTIGSRVAYITQILLGAALVVGRDRISEFLTKVKFAGVDSS